MDGSLSVSSPASGDLKELEVLAGYELYPQVQLSCVALTLCVACLTIWSFYYSLPHPHPLTSFFNMGDMGERCWLHLIWLHLIKVNLGESRITCGFFTMVITPCHGVWEILNHEWSCITVSSRYDYQLWQDQAMMQPLALTHNVLLLGCL